MADDKKKNALFGKILGRKHSTAISAEAEEQESKAEKSIETSDDDYTPEWLTDSVSEDSQDPDEDISDALAELFGENNLEDTNDPSAFAMPGFDELAAEGESNFGIYDTDGDDAESISDNNADETGSAEQDDTYPDDYGYIEEPSEIANDEVYEDGIPAETAEDSIESEYDESETEGFDEASEKASESEKATAEDSVDEDTANLLAALGYSDANTASAKGKPLNKDTSVSRPSDLSFAYGYDGKEYVSRTQTDSLKSKYASDKLKLIVRLGATALFAVLLCVYDMFGDKFGGVLDSSLYPVVNIMISLQLLLIVAAFSVKRLLSGVNAILKGDLNAYSIGAAGVIIAVIYDIVLAITVPETFTLYNFPAAVCVLFCAIHDYFVLEREICVFDRLTSWQSVATLERVDAASLAMDLGEGGMNDGGKTVGQAFRLRKGEFAENYFRHVNRRHPLSKMLAFFVTPSVAIAFIMFFVSLASDKTFAEATGAFAGIALISLPVFMLVSLSFPFYTLTTRRLSADSVVLSESDVNEYRRVDTVVLEESDIFDDTSLTINRISVCDKNQMQDVFDIMCGVSAMYNMIGGRIAGVFRASTADGDVPEDVSVIGVEDGGFEGIAAGRRYCVGSDAYLASKGISVTRYYDDKYIASNPGGVVLHIAVDGAEVFKLYLTYSISPNTLSIINELSMSKTRIVLRTVDPNVNLDLISRILSSSFEGNLTLVRKPYDGTSAEDHQKDERIIDGGIIVNGENPEALLDTVSACRLFGAFSKFNFAVGIVVFAIAALFALLLGIIGAIIGWSSIYVFIVQVLSVLPCIIFANIYLNKD